MQRWRSLACWCCKGVVRARVVRKWQVKSWIDSDGVTAKLSKGKKWRVTQSASSRAKLKAPKWPYTAKGKIREWVPKSRVTNRKQRSAYSHPWETGEAASYWQRPSSVMWIANPQALRKVQEFADRQRLSRVRKEDGLGAICVQRCQDQGLRRSSCWYRWSTCHMIIYFSRVILFLIAFLFLKHLPNRRIQLHLKVVTHCFSSFDDLCRFWALFYVD